MRLVAKRQTRDVWKVTSDCLLGFRGGDIATALVQMNEERQSVLSRGSIKFLHSLVDFLCLDKMTSTIKTLPLVNCCYKVFMAKHYSAVAIHRAIFIVYGLERSRVAEHA